jgi:hypothetical protein
MVNATKSTHVNRNRVIVMPHVNQPVRVLSNVNVIRASLLMVHVVKKLIHVPVIRVIKTVNVLKLVPVRTHVNVMSDSNVTVHDHVSKLITVPVIRVTVMLNALKPVRVLTPVHVDRVITVTVNAVDPVVVKLINV